MKSIIYSWMFRAPKMPMKAPISLLSPYIHSVYGLYLLMGGVESVAHFDKGVQHLLNSIHSM